MDMYSRVLLPVRCESGLQGEKNVGGQHSVHVRNKKVCLFKKKWEKKEGAQEDMVENVRKDFKRMW